MTQFLLTRVSVVEQRSLEVLEVGVAEEEGVELLGLGLVGSDVDGRLGLAVACVKVLAPDLRMV